MSLKICGHLFTGPYDPAKAVIRANHEPVVFAVVEKIGQSWDPRFRLIDIGDTAGAAVSFAEHPERARWEAGATGKLALYYHAPDAESGDAAGRRRALVETIRASWPPDGLL